MDTPRSGLDARTFGLGILAVTACILFVGLILVSQSPPAYAVGMNDRAGDYIMATQQVSTTSEAIAVVDAAAKRMIVYAFDFNNRTLEIVEQVNLDRLPRPRERDGAAPARP
jgi:hypothetical protein